LAVNNGPNHLHGGLEGFDKKVWNSSILQNCEENYSAGVEFRYNSADGEEGYPGSLSISVIYKLTADDKFIMEFSATSNKVTPINITNHTYCT
jgi:aldose 1-epimerase